MALKSVEQLVASDGTAPKPDVDIPRLMVGPAANLFDLTRILRAENRRNLAPTMLDAMA